MRTLLFWNRGFGTYPPQNTSRSIQSTFNAKIQKQTDKQTNIPTNK